MSGFDEYINVLLGVDLGDNIDAIRETVRSLLSEEITSPAGYAAKIDNFFSSRTTDAYAITQTVDGKKYVAFAILVYSSRKHYIPPSIYQYYLNAAIKRTAKFMGKFKRMGYKAGGALICFIGNFTRECITAARRVSKIRMIPVSVRVIPVKPKKKFKIGRFPVKNFKDAAIVVFRWITDWFFSRRAALQEMLIRKGVHPTKLTSNPLYKVLDLLCDKFEKILVGFGDVVKLLNST